MRSAYSLSLNLQEWSNVPSDVWCSLIPVTSAFCCLFSFTLRPAQCIPLSWKTCTSVPVEFQASSLQSYCNLCSGPWGLQPVLNISLFRRALSSPEGAFSFHHCDGVHDMLPQNMAHWNIEYFKLKELEKMAEARMSLWRFPPVALLPWNREESYKLHVTQSFPWGGDELTEIVPVFGHLELART